MKPKSKIIRSIAIILCLPFLLGTITRCGCDGREIHKDLDTTRDYFEDPRRRPEGIEKYDDILYSFHKDELDRLERIYLNEEPGSAERKKRETIYWEYKYDLYSDWDKRIKLREIDGATREEAVKEITIEEILKENTTNWDEAEEYFDEHWGYLFTEETDETEETTLEETTEETTAEKLPGITVDEYLAFLEGYWKLDKGDINFVEAIKFYQAGGCTVEYSIDGETGGLKVVINGEFKDGEPLALEWVFVRIDDNHVSLTQRTTDIPTQTYERHVTDEEPTEQSSDGFSSEVLAWFEYLRGKWTITNGTADYNTIVDFWLESEITDSFSIEPGTGDLLYTDPDTGTVTSRYHKVDENNCILYGVESGKETPMERIK